MRILRLLHGGLAGAAVASGAMLVVLIFVRALGGVRVNWFILLLFLLAAALIGGLLQGLMVYAGGEVASFIVAPTGGTTPYTPTFSHIEALEIRGDLDGAEREWSASCAEHPENALVWVKAADFHLRLRKDPLAARSRYQHVRDLPRAHPDLVRYASQKLVDLHLGPLADEGRALVEMRRLIDRFPGTREAEEARAVLARLKESRRAD